MKPRKWVLVLCAILIAGGAALFEGVRLLERNSELARVLRTQLSPAVGGQFSFESISIGFFSAYLRNVRITVALNSAELAINDIKVGFSLRKLLLTRGDIGQSVNKIILLGPTLTLHQLSSPHDSLPASGSQHTSLDPAGFPVDKVTINSGRVRFMQSNGSVGFEAEHLDGELKTERDGLAFDLKGRIGSLRRNLFVAGLVQRGQGRSRMSVRLDRAKISKPLIVNEMSVLRGTLDGVVELSFGATLTMQDLDMRGTISLVNAHVVSPALVHPVEQLQVHLDLDGGGVIRLDTLGARIGEMSLQAKGVWDLAGLQESHIVAMAGAISAKDILDSVPPLLDSLVQGSGWIQAQLLKGALDSVVVLRAEGGGVALRGEQLRRLGAQGRIAGGNLYLDSAQISTDGARAVATGVFWGGAHKGRYDVRWSGSLDSLGPGLRPGGTLVYDGRVWCADSVVRFGAQIQSDSLVVQSVPLGRQKFSISGGSGRVDFKSLSLGSTEQLSGTVYNPFSGETQLECVMRLGRVTLSRLSASLLPFDTAGLRDASLTATLGGTPAHWEMLAQLRLDAAQLRGGASISMRPQSDGSIVWTVADEDLYAADSLFPVTGTGVIEAHLVRIDSLDLLRGVRLSGQVTTGAVPRLSFLTTLNRVSFRRLNHWFFDGALPLDSGTVSGVVRTQGRADSLVSSAEIGVRGLSFAGLGGLATDLVIAYAQERLAIRPFVVRKDALAVLSVDSLVSSPMLALSGEFDNVDIAGFFGALIPPEMQIAGTMSGSFTSSDSGLPVMVRIASRRLGLGGVKIDSLLIAGTIDSTGLHFSRIEARDSALTTIAGQARVPWSFVTGDQPRSRDTLRAQLSLTGDLLGSVGRHLDSPIKGSARGQADLGVIATAEGWQFNRITASIPKGTLLVHPFVLKPIEGFRLLATMDERMRLHLAMHGTINKVPISIESNHAVPAGYEPFMIGPLDCGVIQVKTPQGPVELHLPGFQDIGEPVDVEFAPRGPFKWFTLCGPVEKTKIVGTWILRNAEFTYPFLNTNELPWDFDPWPYVSFELDLVPGNRKVAYFWDLTTKRSRKLIRFVDAYLDPISKVTLLGRDIDGTFRIEGQLRSFKGSAFFGRVFDRRFEVGVDFSPQPLPVRGYDNWPIVWGSAEAFSDTSRYDRVKLTLQVQDPLTAGISQRGRIAMVPATPERLRNGILTGDSDSLVNFLFQLSSDNQELAGAAESEFYRQTGLKVSTLGGAGEFVGVLGEQYLHRYLLQRLEKRLARRIGLDVISLETSIASNYFNRFYNRQYGEISGQWDMLALANVGLTLGRYVFNDALFLKARGELIPVDELLTPEYSIGLELQPVRFLLMDFNYGVHQVEGSLEHDPRMNLQLRLPITRLRNYLNF